MSTPEARTLWDIQIDRAPAIPKRTGRERQIDRVKRLMLDGKWRTLAEIAAATRDPEASVSARLRDLRNKLGLTVEEERMESGLWRYRVRSKG